MIPYPATLTAALGIAGLSLSVTSLAPVTAPAPTQPPSQPPAAQPFILPGASAPIDASPKTAAESARMLPTPPKPPSNCLTSGDGYLRAQVAGAIDAKIDWPNNGTTCQGEARGRASGVRMSFQRAAGAKPNLLLVFGVSGVRKGEAARELGVNLTVIVQGTNHIYGTLGDSRCTVDTLTQKPLKQPGAYRVEARGFCTQPAHAVRGSGDVLVSTFEFAGPVTFPVDKESL